MNPAVSTTVPMLVARSDEQVLFQETVRAFLERQSPLTTVRAWIDAPPGFDPGWWRRAAELGFTSFLVAPEHGGGNLSDDGLADLLIVAEEMGRLVSPGPLVPTNVVAAAVAELGSSEQRELFLPGILRGESVPAWCGADKVYARVDDDALVLNGTVVPVEAAAGATVLLVTATSADGPTQLLVAADSPGITITALAGIDLTRRFARVDLADVRVDRAAVLGTVGGAASAFDHQVLVALVLQCAESVGAMERVLEFTVDYLGDRYAAGRPLSSYQVLKHYLADLRLWLEAAQGITTLAAKAVHERDDAEELVRAAAAYVGTHGTELAQRAVQLHGGIGITWEHDLHLYLRRVTLNRSLLGTPERHLERLAELSLHRLDDRAAV
jgi:alkylation response protein AidB-like acyl-CoA dehydrogenase